MDFVNLLPPELIEKIFNFLSIADLACVSRVSVSWYIASNSSRLWRAAIKQSFSRDRFIKLSDLDKFNGISSNYDSDHSFNVEKPPTSCLPPMNPWKLSLCRHNFVQSNLRGERPNFKLARHRITLEDDIEMLVMNVTFPSRSAQDGMYLPILGRKRGETDLDLYLIRLDGIPKAIRLFTKVKILYVCIDRHGMMWVEMSNKEDKVNYLCFDENFNSFQSRNSGSSLFECDVHNLCVITPTFRFFSWTMDANHLVVITTCGRQKQVKVWCRKTFKLEFTITPEANIYPFNFSNGHFYLAFNHDVRKVEIYNVKQDKLISVVDVELSTDCIVLGAKYYAIVSELSATPSVCVREINTNKVMFNITLREPLLRNKKFWFVDDYFLYKDKFDLKVLNLIDWTVSEGLSFRDYSSKWFHLDAIDSYVLVIVNGRVDVWDWKVGKKLQEIAMPQSYPVPYNFHVNETRLVDVHEKSVKVVGFW